MAALIHASGVKQRTTHTLKLTMSPDFPKKAHTNTCTISKIPENHFQEI